MQDLQPCGRSEDWLVIHHPLQPEINQSIKSFDTVGVVYIKTMKTTFGFNFEFYQAYKDNGYT